MKQLCVCCRPQERPGEAAGGRVCESGQSRGGTEDLLAGGEHLCVRRQQQRPRGGAAGAQPNAAGNARTVHRQVRKPQFRTALCRPRRGGRSLGTACCPRQEM